MVHTRLFPQSCAKSPSRCIWRPRTTIARATLNALFFQLHFGAKKMRLVDWNIQWGRGVDGRVDLARIVAEAKALHDFDVLCLQEVTRGFHESEQAGGLAGRPGADQFAELEALIPRATVIHA